MCACVPQHYEATLWKVKIKAFGMSPCLPACLRRPVAYDKHKALVTVEGQHVIITTISRLKNCKTIVGEMCWRAKWHSWRGEVEQLEGEVEG